jgi:hypothetical protein
MFYPECIALSRSLNMCLALTRFLLATEGTVGTHGQCVTKINLAFGLRIGLRSKFKLFILNVLLVF